MTLYAIIRIRGTADVPPDVSETLRMLRLTRKFTAVIYPKDPTIDGMLRVVKDWVTWGEIDAPTLKELILTRGRLPGNKPITPEAVRRIFNGLSVDELVNKLLNGELKWHKLDGKVKPVFRLHPPRGGFKRSIKKPVGAGGELGYRGREINDLIRRML